MENTVNEQVVNTPETEKMVETEVGTSTTEKMVETKPEPYKSFSSKEEFDKHSAGILNSAKNKAEKELLALLGLKPDEKDKLSRFKEAYDNTLSESEKQAQILENLNGEVSMLKSQLAEKDAIISALSKLTGKNSNDVDKYVKMAKGLVDDNTSIDQALQQVLDFVKIENKEPSIPKGQPLNEPNQTSTEENPFKTGNFTKQGALIRDDRTKAREMYFAVHGKAPNW